MTEDHDLELVEQLADDFAARLRAGKRPSIKEYTDRHPELAEIIRDTFEALAMMENMAPDSDDSFGAADDESATAPLPDLKQLGDFRIIREVGRGGMGVVYEAEQVSLGRHVALKVLPSAALPDDKHIRRFEREAKSAAKLHHTNIVPVFGVGTEQDLHYYVMQFIRGLPLDEVIEELKKVRAQPTGTITAPVRMAEGGDSSRQRSVANVAHSLMTGKFAQTQIGDSDSDADREPAGERPNLVQTATEPAQQVDSTSSARLSETLNLSGSISGSGVRLGHSSSQSSQAKPFTYWESVANIGLQVADAMQYAHDQGILHRDIKPSNLLLDMRGTAWVTDFGLAKATDQQDITHTGDILGTLRYMPPEAFEGVADARSDVYSLGLTLYELLCFQPAFGMKDRNRLVKQVTTDAAPRLEKLNPEIPRDLVTIIHKAIDRDATHRYQTARELEEDLQRFLDDEPIRARRISTTERIARWSRRNRGLAASLAAVCLLLLVINIAGPMMMWRVSTLNESLEQEGRRLEAETLRANKEAADARAQASENKRIAARETDARDEADRQRDEAGRERAEADRQRILARRALYSSALFASQHAISTPEGFARAQELLDEVRPQAGEEDLRGWEWYYLHAQLLQDGVVLRRFPQHPTSVAYSLDGQLLATSHGSGDVQLFNSNSGRMSQTLVGHEGIVSWVAWSPDGTRLASSGADKTARIWNVETGTEELQLRGHTAWVAVVAWSPDGQRLVTGGLDGAIKTWDATSGDNLLTIRESSDAIRGVDWSPNGQRLVSGGDEQAVRIWEAATGDIVHTMAGHGGKIARVRFSPDGRRIASASWESTETAVMIWDAELGTELSTLSYRTSGAHDVQWSPDGSRLATAGFDNETVDIWDPDTGELLRRFLGHRTRVLGCSWSPDGHQLASAGNDLTVRVWDVVDEQLVIGDAFPVSSLAWNPDGSRIATASLEHGVKIWDVRTRQNLLTLQSERQSVWCIAWDPDGGRLASCGAGQVFRVWDVETGSVLHTINATRNGNIRCVVWSPDGTQIASAGDDGTVRVFDAETGKEVQRFDLPTPYGLDWSHDGERLAAAAYTGNVTVWNVETGFEISHFVKPDQAFFEVRFSRNDGRLAVGGASKPQESIFDDSSTGAEGIVIVWDLESGTELHRLLGHTAMVHSLDWSDDGARLLSAGKDGKLMLWDAATGAQLLVIGDSENQPTISARFSPDELQIASGGNVPGIRFWDASPSFAAELSLKMLDGLDAKIEREPTIDDLMLRGRILSAAAEWDGAAADFQQASRLYSRTGDAPAWIETSWWVAGPYPMPLDEELPPETHLDPLEPIPSANGSNALRWQPAHLSSLQGLNLGRIFAGAEQISAYALTHIYAPEPQTAGLLLGADDEARVWLNGTVIHTHEISAGAVPDDDVVEITLQPGWNTLLFKVNNDRQAHGLFARVSQDPLDLARAYTRNEKWTQAYAWWDRAYSARPDDLEVLLGRGRAALHVGDSEVAEQSFSAALVEHEPIVVRTVAVAYADHARSLINAGQATQAGDSLDRSRALYEGLLSGDGARDEDAAALADVLLADTTRWTVLEPAELSSEAGTTLTQQDDGSILASGENPDSEIYTIVSDVSLDNIRVLRLEVLPHPSIENGATGRGKGGLFTLTEVTGSISAADDVSQPEPLVFDSAVASYERSDEGHNIAVTIDGQRDNRKFWNTYPHSKREATALFEIAPPSVHGPHSRLTINLDFHDYRKDWTQNNLGRFRLSVTDDPTAFETNGRRFTIARTDDPWGRLAAAYAAVGEYTRAADSFAEALERAPEFAARRDIVKRIDELEIDLNNLVALLPDDPLLLNARANRLLATGQTEAAAESFAKARSLAESLQAQLPADEALAGFLADLPHADAPVLRLIPRPRDLTVGQGSLTFTTNSRIVAADPVLTPLAGILSDEIFTVTGVRMLPAEGRARDGDVALQFDTSLEDEAYRIDVENQAVIRGGNYPAVASATVTLLQALQSDQHGLALPKLAIADQPAYPYRAALIDLARQYHTPGGIEQVIELCRLYKIRYLQLHLCDDQLFMFPSTGFPQAGTTNQELTRFEPPSKPRIEPYSIDELRHLEQFASARGVYLVPELDLPGHSGRLIGDVPEPFGFPGNGSTVNIASPKILAAVETLLNEVMDVFQSTPYIHLGADEVGLGGLEQTPEYKALQDGDGIKSPHDLYCRFVADLDRIVTRRGKQTIVWEEAWNVGGAHPLPKDVVVMVWSQGRNPNAIVDSGYPVVNATWTPLYIRREDKKSLEFLHQWAVAKFGREGSEQFTTLQNTGALLGTQLCSWENSECMEIQSMRDRLALVAERTWSPQAGGGLAEFQTRLAHTDAILDRLIHPVFVEVQGEFTGDENTFAEPITITLTPRQEGLTLRYTLDNSLPGPAWRDYAGPIVVDKTVHLRAGMFDTKGGLEGNLVGAWFRRIIKVEPNLATHKPVTVGPGPDRDDKWSSRAAVDGRADDVWAHWASDPAPQWLQIDLEQVYPVDYINVVTFYDGNRYYQLNAEVSVDGMTWHQVLDFSTNEAPATPAGYSGSFPATDARYVRINMLKNSANQFAHVVEVIVKAREQPANDGEPQP